MIFYGSSFPKCPVPAWKADSFGVEICQEADTKNPCAKAPTSEVMGLPTFQIYRNGEQVTSSTGKAGRMVRWFTANGSHQLGENEVLKALILG